MCCVHIHTITLTHNKVKTVEPVEDFPNGWRSGELYQLRADPCRVCIYFGDDEYEGLDTECPYTFIDGVIRDGDGDEVELVDDCGDVDVVQVESVDNDNLFDPELQELEENGGGYLSDDDDDGDFLFGGDGDKNMIK